eukprot:CAMPEP_0168735472 /NCGR_PEP_ID=MMETSP0724-20121128/9352_1 /TAXON_ID=265536 /ORGANISM="Amphiprora sp., Strain CCMP467" /LENGTH=475 /DNA_ID=CAMNT_0008782619 /DNA_START=86 /DNA_END=1513 /DNA_ORIENTATION=-
MPKMAFLNGVFLCWAMMIMTTASCQAFTPVSTSLQTRPTILNRSAPQIIKPQSLTTFGKGLYRQQQQHYVAAKSSTTSLSATTTALVSKTVAIASFSATVKLLCSIALGAWAARKRLKKDSTNTILDGPAIAALSRLTYWIFQPAFLLCSVTKTFALAAATSAKAGGGTGNTLTGTQLALMPLVACFQIGTGAMIGQLLTKKKSDGSGDQQGSIVRMCTTFANSGPLPLLFADALFSKQAMIQSQVVACISFYLLAWSPLFWSFGKLILGTSETTLVGEDKSVGAKIMQQVKQFLSPPVIGSIGGIVIGATPALRELFLNGWLYPLFGAMQTLGTAYLPSALLVLAGSLASKKSDNNNEASKSTAGLSVKSLGTIAFARFLLAPIWALLILKGLDKLQLLGQAGSPARAILSFVILMEGCMPPAQNSVILLQLVGMTGAASTMAQTLTALYGLAVVPVTLLLSACLSLSGISNLM